jgi:hypothetical protein
VESYYAILQDTGNNTGSLYKDAEWVSINCNENMRYRQHKKSNESVYKPVPCFCSETFGSTLRRESL